MALGLDRNSYRLSCLPAPLMMWHLAVSLNLHPDKQMRALASVSQENSAHQRAVGEGRPLRRFGSVFWEKFSLPLASSSPLSADSGSPSSTMIPLLKTCLSWGPSSHLSLDVIHESCSPVTSVVSRTLNRNAVMLAGCAVLRNWFLSLLMLILFKRFLFLCILYVGVVPLRVFLHTRRHIRELWAAMRVLGIELKPLEE